MILSCSRRTDVPAFYADWLGRRLREGSCIVPNPFNPQQQSRISLRPEDVDAIVFWTRHARPLFELLPELDRQGFRYYRGRATSWQEYPSGWERQAAKVRARLMFNRAESRQEDDQDDFLDCVFDNLPRRAALLFF